MKSALKYSSKVWLTTIFIGPLIMAFYIYFLYDWVYDRLANALTVPELGIPIGIVYYLPCWFVFGVSAGYLNKKVASARNRKIYVSLVASILSQVPFVIMDYRSLFTLNTGFMGGFPPDLTWTVTYACLTVGAVWFYKLVPDAKPMENIETSPR